MSIAREALLLLGLTCTAAVATKVLHPHAPAMFFEQTPLASDEVTIHVIKQKWKGGVLWIDARPSGQFEKAHVPGALLINEQERDSLLADALPILQDNTKPVVVYCDSGGCQASRKIRDYLTRNFPTMEFFVLRGGWEAWQTQ